MVTYAEIRQWAVWLNVFTVRDLAHAMAVDDAVAERGVRAMLWHGIVEDTGDELPSRNGDGPEVIFRHKPLPPGPREHPTETPPEVLVGYTEILCPRGMPIGGTGIGDRVNFSQVGNRRPGRRQMKREDRIMRIGK